MPSRPAAPAISTTLRQAVSAHAQARAARVSMAGTTAATTAAARGRRATRTSGWRNTTILGIRVFSSKATATAKAKEGPRPVDDFQYAHLLKGVGGSALGNGRGLFVCHDMA